MSKPRLEAKLRTNAEFPAISAFLKAVGMDFTLHNPPGKGHPYIDIRLPHGGEPLRHYINCTPKGGGNPKGALSKLRRALREAGYDLGH